MTDGFLPQGGADGRGLAPAWAEPGGWETVVEIHEGDPGDWATRRDLLRSATVPIMDRTAEMPYDMVYNDEDMRTRFCRPTRRIIPTDEQYLVRRTLQAQIAFTANDPLTYGPEVESGTLEAGDAYTYEPTGWAMSQRWKWVVTGTAVRPQLAIHVDGYTDQILRYNGSFSGGSVLVVESTPHGLTTTLDGINVFGTFDGGSAVDLPGFFSIPPGEQQVLFDFSSGSATAEFTWRTALI